MSISMTKMFTAALLVSAPLLSVSAQQRSTITQQQIEAISQGDYFIGTAVQHADGLVEGDNLILQISYPVRDRTLQTVLIESGNRIGCHIGKKRDDSTVDATCDRFIIQDGYSIPFYGYVTQNNGGRGITEASLKAGTGLVVVPTHPAAN